MINLITNTTASSRTRRWENSPERVLADALLDKFSNLPADFVYLGFEVNHVLACWPFSLRASAASTVSKKPTMNKLIAASGFISISRTKYVPTTIVMANPVPDHLVDTGLIQLIDIADLNLRGWQCFLVDAGLAGCNPAIYGIYCFAHMP